MKKQVVPAAIWAALFGVGVCSPAHAGVVYKDGDKYLKLGGRIQLQYHQVDPEDGDSADDLFFRRLRPYIEGSVHKDWKGKFQWDMGKADGENEISIKDAYLQYKGFDGISCLSVTNCFLSPVRL